MKINTLFLSGMWSRRDRIFFLERMEMFLSAGLTLDQALMTAEEGVQRKKKQALREIRHMIEGGGKFSHACEKLLHFSRTIVSLLRQGESSGELRRAMTMARTLLEREDELIKKCISALTYPIVIAVFASLLMFGLMRGIMPQIIPMLKGLHVELPLLTRVVMALSDALSAYGLYGICAVVAGGIGFCFWYKRSVVVRSVCQEIISRLPIIGKLQFLYHISVLLYSCGALVESGYSATLAFSSTTKDLSLYPLKRIFKANISSVAEGAPLGRAFVSRNIPHYIPSLISAGERSGTLGISLTRAAGVADRDIEHSLKRLTSLIEPVMMAGMGCVVGAIALSIMMPIYDVSKVLQH